MKDYYYGLNMEALSLKGIDRKQFARLLLISTLINPEQINELITSKLPNMTDVELEELLLLLKENVSDISGLFKSLGRESKKNETYKQLVAKFRQFEQVFAEPIKISELKEIAEVYSLQIHDLLQDVGNCMITPASIKAYIDEFVIGQEQAKKALSSVMYNHLLRIGYLGIEADAEKLPRNSLLLIGETGSGKTYMIKLLEGLFDIPFTIVNASALTSSGYTGENPDAALTNLLIKASGDINKAMKGVVVLDESDKIATRNTDYIGSTNVQEELLSIIEGCELNIPKNHGRYADKVNINTSNLCFLFAGAFQGIDEVVNKRLGRRKLGIGPSMSTCDSPPDQTIISTDLVAFGLMPELIGRINKIVQLKPLNKEDILSIMINTKNNALAKELEFFELHNIKVEIDPETFELIARKVVENGLGARYITNCWSKIFEDHKFEAPSTKGSKIRITKEEALMKLTF
jgi:ATP-dependent Clp protease ATP-binding subunit ClpX